MDTATRRFKVWRWCHDGATYRAWMRKVERNWVQTSQGRTHTNTVFAGSNTSTVSSFLTFALFLRAFRFHSTMFVFPALVSLLYKIYFIIIMSPVSLRASLQGVPFYSFCIKGFWREDCFVLLLPPFYRLKIFLALFQNAAKVISGCEHYLVNADIEGPCENHALGKLTAGLDGFVHRDSQFPTTVSSSMIPLQGI